MSRHHPSQNNSVWNSGSASSSRGLPPIATSRQPASRQSSTSSQSSLISPSAGSSRSRAITSAGSPRLSTPARLAKHSPSASISLTQLSILLSTIKENNFDTQAEKIRSLVDEHGMDVFSTFFRRLLQSNATTIFPNAVRPQAGSDTAAQYKLLSEEMAKVARDPQQAERIAYALDTNEGELFRDFDLSTFIDHFRLNPIAKVALVLPMRIVAKLDLRSKGMTIHFHSPALRWRA